MSLLGFFVLFCFFWGFNLWYRPIRFASFQKIFKPLRLVNIQIYLKYNATIVCDIIFTKAKCNVGVLFYEMLNSNGRWTYHSMKGQPTKWTFCTQNDLVYKMIGAIFLLCCFTFFYLQLSICMFAALWLVKMEQINASLGLLCMLRVKWAFTKIS